MKLQILAITLLFSFASIYPSQQHQSNQPIRTVGQILNDVVTHVNQNNLRRELASAQSTDGREPQQDDPRIYSLLLPRPPQRTQKS